MCQGYTNRENKYLLNIYRSLKTSWHRPASKETAIYVGKYQKNYKLCSFIFH
jgi:hypothetical protein